MRLRGGGIARPRREEPLDVLIAQPNAAVRFREADPAHAASGRRGPRRVGRLRAARGYRITIIASASAVFPIRSVVMSSSRVVHGKSNRIASCRGVVEVG